MKKWLACFMSVVMLFASFPVSILAEEAGQEPSAQITENNTVTENQEVDKTAESVEEASSEAVESSEPQRRYVQGNPFKGCRQRKGHNGFWQQEYPV